MVKNASKKQLQPASYEYTIRVAHLVKDVAFKKRAPRAIREIKKIAAKVMSTKDVRIDTTLNEKVWASGIRHLPRRVRVRFCRRRNEAEDSAEPFYTLVQPVDCARFKEKKHEMVREE